MTISETIAEAGPVSRKNVVIAAFIVVSLTLFVVSPPNPQKLKDRIEELEKEMMTKVQKVDDISRYLCVTDFGNARLSGIDCRGLGIGK